LYRVTSDYKPFTDEELRSCSVDSDCVYVYGCCGCNAGGSGTLINKKYLDDWNSMQKISCQGIGCPAVMSRHWTCIGLTTNKCIKNSCTFVNYTEDPCEIPMYESCKNIIPKSQWGDYVDYNYPPNCRDIVTLCEKDLSQEEVYGLCMQKIKLPDEFLSGSLVIYFDPNSSENDIGTFIDNSGLEIKRKYTDYRWEIRETFDLLNANLTLVEKDNLVKNETESLVNYLRSSSMVKDVSHSSYRVYEPHRNFGMYDNYIIVNFYGSYSPEESEKFIKEFKDIPSSSLDLRNAQRIGIVRVPEGKESEWICKLREEIVIFTVRFDSG
jgi:hypothetical protein